MCKSTCNPQKERFHYQLDEVGFSSDAIAQIFKPVLEFFHNQDFTSTGHEGQMYVQDSNAKKKVCNLEES